MSEGWRLSRAGACSELGSAVGRWRSVQGLAEEAYGVHLRAAGLCSERGVAFSHRLPPHQIGVAP